MNDGYSIFWGDTHHNTYQHYVQDPALDRILSFASTYLDFYTGAYYTPVFRQASLKDTVDLDGGFLAGGHPSEKDVRSSIEWRGCNLEGLKERAAMSREWAEFQDVTTAWNKPGEFVAFPGYEWQGNGRWGDHNVIHKTEGDSICTEETLPALYHSLRDLDAIAVPHHTGYCVGQRAPDWSACDETISPFAEVFSIHGCSETDEEWIGLRHNSHMGPGAAGGTYQEALDRGLHLGAICSTDNWSNMPGHWGQGLMACLARELTRESLWEAFLARRVYGVTGDRIQLEFSCNGTQMGGIAASSAKRNLSVSVRGSDAIDRIEILRNGRVIHTYCHQGTWRLPEPGTVARFKFRIEPGWGPRIGEIPCAVRRWTGELSVNGGRILGWEPCWVVRDQGVPQISGDSAIFEMASRQEYVSRETQGATVFEFEADVGSEMALSLNGLETRDSVGSFAEGSRLIWYRDECVEFIRDTTGVEPSESGRGDAYYQLAHKAKLHRAIPEAGYMADVAITDDDPIEAETHYRVRVEQRNGQRAWSSPIWVRP